MMNDNNYSHLALSDSGFLFDTNTGFTYTLNPLGTVLLQGIIAGKKLDEITDEVIDVFDVGFEQASHDMQQFSFQLEELRLIPQTRSNGDV